jgi:hypothetical protein
MSELVARDTNAGWAAVPGIGLIATSDMIIGPAGSLAQSLGCVRGGSSK